MCVLGNAIGNSIVDKSTPRASTPETKKQSGSGFDWESSEAVGASNFYGADVSGFAKDLDFNPDIDYTPTKISPDQWKQALANADRALANQSSGTSALDNLSLKGADSTPLTLAGNGTPTLASNDLQSNSDPLWKTDPSKYYASKLSQTERLLSSFGTSSVDRNRGINHTYANIFAESGQPWFGLATIASSKVGEGLGQSSLGSTAASVLLEGYADFPVGAPLNMADLDENLSILNRGLGEGNRSVFKDQYTAYQIYKDGGVAALQAVVSTGVYGGNQNVGELVEGYKAWDNAKALRMQGDQIGSLRAVDRSLRSLATFEQGVILQPIYDTTFSVINSAGETYKNTFGGALRSSSSAAESFGYDPTKVNVLGTSISGKGLDLGNFDQRMKFVDRTADQFMSVYSSPNGIQKIRDWNQKLLR